jgi:biopolymer transport protein ExbD
VRRVRLTPSRSTALEAINVTPLIDVVMCLIIFFLIVGKLAHEQGARVNLPATGLGTTDEDRRAVVITVAPVSPTEKLGTPDTRFELTGNSSANATDQPRVRITVDGEFVTTQQQLSSLLNRRLQRQTAAADSSAGTQAAAQLPVQVRVDRDLPYAVVAPALSACKELGLTSVRLITERTNP